MTKQLLPLLSSCALTLLLAVGTSSLQAHPTADQESAQSKEKTEADAEDAVEEEAKEDDKEEKLTEQHPVVTQHETTIEGKTLAYQASAGKLLIKTDKGDEKASIFYTAYTLQTSDEEVDVSRPITFCFNGGPGSSSVWLHLGFAGPQRVDVPSDAGPAMPPFKMVPNDQGILDVTDLVFIDPVSTGYSRPVEGEDKKQFHGYDEDLNSVGQFIHDYTSQHGRWSSPKFLMGESYGGLRAAGLSGKLQSRYRMYLNGIIMVSPVVDFQTIAFSEGNDLPYILFLPSYATTAWYHGKLSDDLQQLPVAKIYRRAKQFAEGPFAQALLRGDGMKKKQRQKIVRQMAQFTGLSAEYIERSNLRIPMWYFGKELLRKQDRTVGRFDSRYTGIDRRSVGESTDYDPSGAAVMGPYTAAMNDYLRRSLQFEDERVYEILTGNVRPWNYDRFENRYVTAAESLRSAMTENPYLKVLTACGYYDLATPASASEFTARHLELAPELRDNYKIDFYEGGHMMYLHKPSLEKLRRDVVQFYTDALDPGEAPF